MVDPIDELMQRMGIAPVSTAVVPGAGGRVEPPAVPTAPGTTPVEQHSALPDALPVIEDPEGVLEHFYRQHGRVPLEPELRAIRALPILARDLGRMPTKLELLTYLDGRNETPKPAQQEYQVGQ